MNSYPHMCRDGHAEKATMATAEITAEERKWLMDDRRYVKGQRNSDVKMMRSLEKRGLIIVTNLGRFAGSKITWEWSITDAGRHAVNR